MRSLTFSNLIGLLKDSFALKLKVNNMPTELLANENLADLLTKLLLIEKKGIAVAVNNRVIARNKWSNFTLSDNDEVIIIEAARGG